MAGVMQNIPRTWWRRLTQVFRLRAAALPWLDLTQGESDEGYSKAALRAIIERRRRSDLVRRRELEQLRQARHRGLLHGEPPSGESVPTFQASPLSVLDEREMTLRKIDDIESQMSRQWWAKAALTSVPPLPVDQPVPATAEFAPTQYAGAVTEAEWVLSAAGRRAGARGRARGGASVAVAPNLDDPDLAEAALRWAVGDGTQAEAILLNALRGGVAQGARVLHLTALLDLYRATDQRAGFDRALAEFSNATTMAPPLWRLATGGGEPIGGHEQAGPLEQAAEWTGEVVALLHRLTAECDGARPLVLSCARLQRVDFVAAGALLSCLQGRRCPLELREVSPLVSTFLKIIGIDGLARLIPRRV